MNTTNTLQHVPDLGLDAARGIGRRIACAVRRIRQRQRQAATLRQLARLDPRTLRDIGIDPSEVHSLAAEMHGFAERTRMHAALRPPPWAGS